MIQHLTRGILLLFFPLLLGMKQLEHSSLSPNEFHHEKPYVPTLTRTQKKNKKRKLKLKASQQELKEKNAIILKLKSDLEHVNKDINPSPDQLPLAPAPQPNNPSQPSTPTLLSSLKKIREEQRQERSILPISLFSGFTTALWHILNFKGSGKALEFIEASLIITALNQLSSRGASALMKKLIGYSDSNTNEPLNKKNTLYTSLFKPTLIVGNTLGFSLSYFMIRRLIIPRPLITQKAFEGVVPFAATIAISSLAASVAHSVISPSQEQECPVQTYQRFRRSPIQILQHKLQKHIKHAQEQINQLNRSGGSSLIEKVQIYLSRDPEETRRSIEGLISLK